ncbi:MAG: hypothetical protein QXI16_05565 [Sulfolobaceae archaeon]
MKKTNKYIKYIKRFSIMIVTLLLSFTILTQNVHAIFVDDTSIANPDLTLVSTFQNESYYRLSVGYMQNDMMTIIDIHDFEQVFNTLVPSFYNGYVIWSIDNDHVDRYVVLSGNNSLVDEIPDVDYIVFNRYTSDVEFYLEGTNTPFITYDSGQYSSVGLNLQAIVIENDSQYTDIYYRTMADFYSPIQPNVERNILRFEYPYNTFTNNIVDLATNLALNERLVYNFYFHDAIENEYYLNLDGNFVQMFDITYVMIVNGILRLYQSDKNLRYTVNLNNYTTVSLHYNYIVQDYELLDATYQAGYDDGFDDGKLEGITTTEQDSYDQGYIDGGRDSFMASIKDWIVPAIIVVLFLGGALTVIARKREG